MWLELQASLGQIQQPFNLTRLCRFVERPIRLGPSAPLKSTLLPAVLWGRHVGDHIGNISALDLAEFCVGHELEFRLSPDHYPPNHADFSFVGPRSLRA